MGKVVPFLGPMMRTRIFWHDTPEGVLYQYEMVIGQHNAGPLSNLIRSKITAGFTAEMVSAWNRHNSIEVGTFENFLLRFGSSGRRCGTAECRFMMRPR